MWTTIRCFHTARFSVSLQWAWEDYPDLSWDDNGSIRADIERGKLGVYTFRVVVLCDGREVGADYLGNSVYADPADFGSEHRAGTSYFSDMVTQAITEARKALCGVPRLRCT
jgi:hypothetical protein